MKDNSGNIKQFTAEDIRRYVQDEMSPAEMHAIEKAALDDPFLADAIEGFSSGISEHGLASVENSAINLQTEFAERISEKKKRNLVPVIKMKWWQGAVAAGIIVTAGVLGYRSYNDRAEELLLTVNETSSVKDKAVKDQTIAADSIQPQASTMESQKSDTSPDIAKTEENGKIKPAAKTTLKKSNENSRDEKKQFSDPSMADNSLTKNEKSLFLKKKAGATNQQAVAANQKAVLTYQKADAPNQKAAVRNQKADAAVKEIAESDKKVAATQRATTINEKNNAINEKAVATDDKELADAKRAAVAAVTVKKSEESESRKEVNANLQVDTTRAKSGAPIETKLSGKVAGVDFNSPKATAANQSTLNYFNGQIVTSDNKPLSNAILKLNNNATIYTTDNNGKFSIASPDSVIEVEASMVGRETTRFRLQKDDETNNLLLPDAGNSLNEVVVIGYGTQRKKDITGSVTVSRREAEPEGGWLVWEKYLQTNKDSTLILNGSAETELSFQVTTKNKLSQFRVIRSISAKHDQEVIRLVKEGPKWNLRKGKKATVTLTMRF